MHNVARFNCEQCIVVSDDKQLLARSICKMKSLQKKRDVSLCFLLFCQLLLRSQCMKEEAMHVNTVGEGRFPAKTKCDSYERAGHKKKN